MSPITDTDDVVVTTDTGPHPVVEAMISETVLTRNAARDALAKIEALANELRACVWAGTQINPETFVKFTHAGPTALAAVAAYRVLVNVAEIDPTAIDFDHTRAGHVANVDAFEPEHVPPHLISAGDVIYLDGEWFYVIDAAETDDGGALFWLPTRPAITFGPDDIVTRRRHDHLEPLDDSIHTEPTACGHDH